MPPPQSIDPAVGRAVLSAAGVIRQLSRSGAAPLRNLQPPITTALFWRLAVRHPTTIGNPAQELAWAAVFRMLVRLTPLHLAPAQRPNLHNPVRPLGALLCDGGDASAWLATIDHRPFLSERRLAWLIAARGARRIQLLERATAGLAHRLALHTDRDDTRGLDLRDLATASLGTITARRLAEPYYAVLERAGGAASSSPPSFADSS